MNMFKVLLVDDEPNVRQGIRMMIPWDEIDCEVIDEANDGDEGLSKIMTQNPDIVIADIKMPGKTGIEMTEAAKAMGFKGKVLILSGYSDFSYAKTAIALGVENFILKPVDEDELIEAIKTAGDKIRRENEHRYKQEIGVEYLNERLIKGLFAGNSDAVAKVSENYSFNSFMASIICYDGSGDSDEYYAQIRQILGVVENVDVVTLELSGVLGVLFKGWKQEEIKTLLNRVTSSVGENVYITCGVMADSAEMISRSYSTAESLYKNRFIFRHCQIATPESLYADSEDIDYASRLYAYMEINDKEKIGHVLDVFMRSMQRLDNTPEKAKISCITMVIDIRSKFVRSAADRKPESMITDEFLSGLEEMTTLYEMINEIKNCLCAASDSCFGKTPKSNMERVVQYIHANYNQELRLEMLAGIFGYNSAYLGKVFHQYTGENFNNYLDEIRITEAKRLLADEDHKVYEVAEMVGYSNINYFHNKFKKYVGTSPLAYKKQHGHTDE